MFTPRLWASLAAARESDSGSVRSASQENIETHTVDPGTAARKDAATARWKTNCCAAVPAAAAGTPKIGPDGGGTGPARQQPLPPPALGWPSALTGATKVADPTAQTIPRNTMEK